MIIKNIHRGIAVNPEREDLWRDRFIDAIKEIGVSIQKIGPDRGRLLVKLSFEAIQNVYDHSARKPRLDRNIKSHFRIWKEKNNLFMEISDCGIGMAARHTLNPLIYQGSLEEEKMVIRECLKSRGSSKLRSSDCRIRGTPGYGFTYILDAINRLGANATLTTGRLSGKLSDEGIEFGHEVTEFFQGTNLTIGITL